MVIKAIIPPYVVYAKTRSWCYVQKEVALRQNAHIATSSDCQFP